IEESKKTSDSPKITYKKTIKKSFCTRIWIIMKFDKHDKLSEYEIEAGGCDDQACERDINEKGEQKIEFFENGKGLKYP
ncbi:MAG TPA: hypothetical protein VFG02_10130, partial [Nitrospirota bacterium]|nr:hypothetical protein [Nitrospirota bacterium]